MLAVSVVLVIGCCVSWAMVWKIRFDVLVELAEKRVSEVCLQTVAEKPICSRKQRQPFGVDITGSSCIPFALGSIESFWIPSVLGSKESYQSQPAEEIKDNLWSPLLILFRLSFQTFFFIVIGECWLTSNGILLDNFSYPFCSFQ